MSPRTAVAIVNWGGPECVRECVRSFVASGVDSADIVVVDNAHPGRDSDALRGMFDGISVVRPEANLGFAGGANAGIEWGLDRGYDYVFISNNDLAVQGETLSELAAVMDAREDVGIVGAVPCYRDTGAPHFSRGAINWRRGKPMIEEGDPKETEPYETEFATGCCVLLRGAALRQSGLFDPGYFLYWEDVDLCFRMREAGYGVVMAPRARALHDLSRSTGHSSPLTLYYQTRNRLKFFRRHVRGVRRWLLIGRICLSRCLRGMVLVVRGRGSEGRAYLAGIRDFWLNREGAQPGTAT